MAISTSFRRAGERELADNSSTVSSRRHDDRTVGGFASGHTKTTTARIVSIEATASSQPAALRMMKASGCTTCRRRRQRSSPAQARRPQGSVRLAAWSVWDDCQPGCCRAACDSSGVWPLDACLGNDLSARVRRRRSGARCWLDQELVRLTGVTHHRPAAAVCPHQTGTTGPYEHGRRIESDACRRAGLRAWSRHPSRRARDGDRYRAGGCGGCWKVGARERAWLSGVASRCRSPRAGETRLGD